jgi:predicted murein hydrolase (TIGR00659 family)
VNQDFTHIWVYLAASPLTGLSATLLAYLAASWVFKKARFHPLANPVLVSVLIIVPFLLATGVSYKTYFDGAQFVHFLLGPATVSLAVPLYRQVAALKRSIIGVSTALVIGALAAAASAVLIAKWLGAPREVVVSLAPKSVTSPIAMGISERIGGLPSLTTVLVLITGVIGAVIGTAVLDAVRIKDWKARGFAIGLAAHGIGTARAIQLNETAGAFAGLAMGLNGVVTAVLVPLLVSWLKL